MQSKAKVAGKSPKGMSGKVPRKTLAMHAAETAKIAAIKKSRRYRPGTVALREIRRFQKSTESLIPLLPFSRLVREEMAKHGSGDLRLQKNALLALREAMENLLVQHLEMTQQMAVHAKRITILPKDSQRVVMTARQLNCRIYQLHRMEFEEEKIYDGMFRSNPIGIDKEGQPVFKATPVRKAVPRKNAGAARVKGDAEEEEEGEEGEEEASKAQPASEGKAAAAGGAYD